ncbi:NCS2 family permease [Halococcus hamelinensis]|uniref:Xanthine/uracil/vitamin C permease n=1 Tax=Halococcus hamelinensis 100A6 TaxID=1132509 RepID=M0M5Y0_9EURY|nr:NCS2 family permease [Halococcus hamelinensis]EMA40813.1 xanthine/uracil/vitamin C permease [Halococcus hamelinensis 100A6]
MGARDTVAAYFGFDEHDTDLRTELLAGLTTFLTMSYIVVVNPSILGAAISVPGRTDAQTIQMIAVVTLVSAAVATLVMGLYANRPFGQAPGLGLNAFFAFTVVLGLGVPWQTALAAVVVEGVLFLVLTAVGAREFVINLIPEPVKFAVGTGIGLFLAIIGLEAMRVVAGDASTFVQFNPVFASDPVAVLAVLGLFFTLVLYVRGTKGAIIIGIITTALAGYVASLLGFSAFPADQAPEGTTLLSASLVSSSGLQYSAAGYDITPLVGAFVQGFQNVDALSFALIVFTFFFVDFFDTAGTLTGVGQVAGFLDDDGNLPDIDKPLMADAVGTTIGGILGTSTVTTYVESSTGVEEGGRTGLVAVVVGVLFLVSLLFVPLASAIPQYASHIALVMVAVLMLQNVAEVDWNDLTHAVPAGLTILVMPFTYSIAYGIAAGIISYPIVKTARGQVRDVSAGQWVLALAFVCYFFVRTSGILAGQL